MNTVCTIVTSNYFPYAVTLYKSLIKLDPKETLHVLVCDEEKITQPTYPGIKIIRIKELLNQSPADILYAKYATNDMDALRWSMKPVFLSWLLQKKFEKVIYCDCDIYFTGNYSFIYEALNNSTVLLTPHWYTKNPFLQEGEFKSWYKFGLYNAGFMAVSPGAIPCLQWWATICSWKIEKNFCEGYYDDQKYLDAIPVLFDNVHILKHKGCNIAFWNQHECKRVKRSNQVLINDDTDIIFIHFTNLYIKELLEGNDALIFSYFKEYEKLFFETGYSFSDFIDDVPAYKKNGLFKTFKGKLLLRTRIKNWLFHASQSI